MKHLSTFNEHYGPIYDIGDKYERISPIGPGVVLEWVENSIVSQ